MSAISERFALCVATVALVTCMPGGAPAASDYQTQRDAMLNALAGTSSHSSSRVRAVPDLIVGKRYSVGDVLTPSTWPHTLTGACSKSIPAERSPLTAIPELQNGREISFAAQPPTLIQKAIAEIADFKAAFANRKSVHLSYEPDRQEGITSYREYLKALSGDTQCLAEIGNKTSFVVTRVFYMKQKLKWSRSIDIGGNVKIFKTDAFELKYNESGDFVVTDASSAPRALMLQEFRFDVAELDETAAVEAKRNIIRKKLQNETGAGGSVVRLVIPDASPSVLLLPE